MHINITNIGALLADLPGSARSLARIGLGLVHNRLELLGLELAEEKDRLAGLLIWAGLLLTFTLMFLVVLTVTVVAFVPDGVRPVALLAFCAVYLLGALACLFKLRAKVKGPRPFDQTLKELSKDREAL